MTGPLPVPSIQFADNIETTINYCRENCLTVNRAKSCYNIYHNKNSTPPTDLLVHDQVLKYNNKPCYLGLCISASKADKNSIMIRKATKAAFALRSMLDNTVSAKVINQLFTQLIKPILMYGVEQWLPYIHPRKIEQEERIQTFSSLNTQLPTEQTWKDIVYSQYSLHTTTPTLGVHAELGSFQTFVPCICQLTNYASYICSPTAPPLIHKAVSAHKAMASNTKSTWWNNTWHLLQHFHITEDVIPDSTHHLQDDICGEYRRWWVTHLSNQTNAPKLDTFRKFHQSFHTAPYLNKGPHYLCPQALRFRCSNHCLDIEPGRHSNTPRQERTCRFCQTDTLGDEYHSFICPHFLDLKVYYGIDIQFKPQFLNLMQTFPTNVQRYLSVLMSRIRLR